MAAQLTDAAHPLLYEINPSPRLDVLDGDSRLLNVLNLSDRMAAGLIHRNWKDLR